MTIPIITVPMLLAAPLGVSWTNLVNAGSADAQLAAQSLLCQQASTEFERLINQPVRAVVNNEQLEGPNFRLTVQNNGNGRFLCSRWPVWEIISGQSALATGFPLQWQPIPANMMRIESPALTRYNTIVPDASADAPSVILIAPGYVSWWAGRNGMTAQVSYVAGWPHAGTTAPSAAGALTLAVDDCTGYSLATPSTPIAAQVYDPERYEQVSIVGASASAGPGTVTLAEPTLYAHPAVGTAVTTVPSNIIEACLLIAKKLASFRGAVATAPQVMPGRSAGLGREDSLLDAQIEAIAAAYRRVY